MKFGAEYQAALQKGEYPPQWINSSINYKKLKQCIKQIRNELLSLGLDHDTLEALWQHVGAYTVTTVNNSASDRLVQYGLTNDDGGKFVPRLRIAIDPDDGSPIDAWLAPETKRILRRVGRRSLALDNINIRPTGQLVRAESHNSANSNPNEPAIDREGVDIIEIPLTSDGEFFQILRRELQTLEDLEVKEQKELVQTIESLGHDLEAVKARANKKRPPKDAKLEIDTWREIFRIYIDSEVFMSDHECDAGVRTADKATVQLQNFAKALQNRPVLSRPKSKEAHVALERFMSINTKLLTLIRFQELNRRALTKILKKFDKKTSLHMDSGTISRNPTELLHSLSLSPHPNTTRLLSPSTLVRATASIISTSLLNIIPQLDDYLCPVCMSITYRPIRLRCNHVFCIRCMIRLQRDSKDECPMCRERVVLEATEDHLDKELQRFLKREFGNEVAEKKRENELLAGKEVFGEDYNGTHKCAVM